MRTSRGSRPNGDGDNNADDRNYDQDSD